MLFTIVSALAIGLAFGYVLQRGRFCLNCAFRDFVFGRDYALFRAYVLALAVQLIGVNLFAQLGLLKLAAPSFFWLAALVGGFVFGLGMSLARGCASAIWYRSGEGKVAAMIGVIGFASGLGLARLGIFMPFQELVHFQVVRVDGEFATVANVLGLSPWIPIAVLITVAVIVLKGPSETVRGGWAWPQTGLVLGLVGIVAWFASSASGRTFGLSGTDTTQSLASAILRADFSLADWGTFMILATPFGSFLAARRAGEFKWRIPQTREGFRFLGGGLLMGFGATTAAGCSIGHALTGVAILALSSITATVFIFVGVLAGSYLLAETSVRPSR